MATEHKQPKCFEKISESSPLYLRRLAKEINQRVFSGVYFTASTGERDRVVGARIMRIAGPRVALHLKLMDERSARFHPGVDALDDGMGGSVCAVTTRCGR